MQNLICRNGRVGRWESVPVGTDSMSAPGAQRVLLAVASAFFIFLLKPGADTGFQKGISCPAGHDSGLCPEDPQAFRKRLERKLQQGYDLFYNSRRVERVERVIAR